MKRNTIVVNFYAGPGAGKTTFALKLAYMLKNQGYVCEFVSEFAKELVYANEFEKLKNQEYVTNEQIRRIELYRNKVDFIITDSPILLGIIYGQNNPKNFATRLLSCSKAYNNLNFYVTRNKPYEPIGRIQTETEAIQKDREILALLQESKIPFETVKYGCLSATLKIIKQCKKEYMKLI